MERRLGRGLGSLISSPAPDEPSTEISLDAIRPNPFQPRRTFDPDALEELRQSLERHGLLQPVVLRRREDGYELVSGERRWRAARLAGWAAIPAVVREEVADGDMLELALVENVQRRDLDPIERARGFRRLADELGLTQDAIAGRVGLQRSTVTNHLRLLELPDPVQDAVAQGLVSMGHARALLGLGNERRQVALVQEIVRRDLSVREVEARVRAARDRTKPPAPAKEAPPWVATLEARLREALGTKVTLEGSGERGRIRIDYFSRDDLERLLERLSPQETL